MMAFYKSRNMMCDMHWITAWCVICIELLHDVWHAMNYCMMCDMHWITVWCVTCIELLHEVWHALNYCMMCDTHWITAWCVTCIELPHDVWHALNYCRVKLCLAATIPPFLAIYVTLTVVIFHFSCISFNISYIEGVLKWNMFVSKK